MDVTNYLPTYKLTPRELARKIVLDVLDTTGITATAGIGPNLYLAKVAMDIWAKHTRPDKSGVRIAELDELSYRTGNEAAFTYFQPDGRKSGGAYVTALGTVKKLNPLEGRLILTDGTAIPIENILEIDDGVSAKENNAD